jgi:hypothetical protein
MNTGKTLFAQLMNFLPWSTFGRFQDLGMRQLSSPLQRPWRGSHEGPQWEPREGKAQSFTSGSVNSLACFWRSRGIFYKLQRYQSR